MDPLEQRGLVRIDLPEHGSVRLPLAGFGGRAAAAVLDGVIITVVIALLVLAGALVSGHGGRGVVIPALIGLLSLLPVLVPLGFELVWRGASPGKRALQIRVLSADGSSARPGQLLLRNILRWVDFLPFAYGLGTIAMFLSGRDQRLGDLVAGTLVVREDPDALHELAGHEGPESIPAALHGLPESLVRAARLLQERSATLPPSIALQRRAEILQVARHHRPDWAQDPDELLWSHIAQALDSQRSSQPQGHAGGEPAQAGMVSHG